LRSLTSTSGTLSARAKSLTEGRKAFEAPDVTEHSLSSSLLETSLHLQIGLALSGIVDESSLYQLLIG